jgi:thiol-disulfide isomerase/thioredoxin
MQPTVVILPVVDVRTNADLPMFEKAMKSNKKKACMIWAKWCGHCHTMMPHFDAAAKSPNRSVQAIKIEESMLPAVNNVLTSKVNRTAKPINVEGYPSIILVDNKGNKITDIEPVRDTKVMTEVMEKAGPLADSAGLNNAKNMEGTNINANNMANVTNMIAPPKVAASTKKVNNANKANNNKAKNLLANIGVANEGLAARPRNIDIGEDELKGSIASLGAPKNNSIKLNSVKKNSVQKTKSMKVEVPEDAIAPSPINTTPPMTAEKAFSADRATNANNAFPKSMKQLSEEAEKITSMQAPLSPPSASGDMEGMPDMSEVAEQESISNDLPVDEKFAGGGRGGSLYAAMARTTYTLAPAAALLATAAMVMKRKNRGVTRKSSKKGAKRRAGTRRRR